MRITEHFTFFWGTSEVYSNWHPAQFVVKGITYVNTEQYMMAEKARLFDDITTLAKIMAETDPREIKKLGREVKGYVDAVWVENRERVMYEGCLAKFSQNPSLRKELLSTVGTELVEASPYDTIWGIGLGERDPRALNKATWRGLNLLGIALMRVRDTLLKEEPQQAALV